MFARGVCRKHYEQERLNTAALCSISGCTNKAYRGTECAKHYRARLHEAAEKCTVFGCNEKQITAKAGLCKRHYFRYNKYGTVEQTRNSDWGARETHPLYQTYHWHRRKVQGMCAEWTNDFWAFVAAVTPKPEGHSLRRYDNSQPLSPTNWYWKEVTSSKDAAAWQRAWRTSNPDKVKDTDLRRRFGISLDEYRRMHEAQQGVCAICAQPETALDAKGAVRFMPVDHCHKTNKIRALLCSACNKALGGFKDDPDTLRKAAEYVERYR